MRGGRVARAGGSGGGGAAVLTDDAHELDLEIERRAGGMRPGLRSPYAISAGHTRRARDPTCMS